MKKEKRIFLIRLGLYLLFGALLPAAFLVWRFKLFRTLNGITVGGWGIVFVLFVAIFLFKLAKQVKAGMPVNFWSRLITVFIKVFLPLLTATICLHLCKGYIDQLFQFFLVLTICETIGGVSNPLPEWAAKNNIKETDNAAKRAIDYFFSKKEQK